MKPELRGPLPLDERDFTEIRGRVLQKIATRPLLPVALRFALAAAAVIALVFVLLPRQGPQKPPPLTRPLAPLGATLSPPARGEGVRVRTERPEIVRAVPEPKKPKPVAVASSGAPPADTDMHIEIQTADPNVRIIWIAR